MRIVLFLATGQYNLGDELLLLAEWNVLRTRYPNARFSIATYDPRSSLLPTGSVYFFSYFPNALRRHPIRNIGAFFRTVYEISRADLVIVGGGGLLFDDEAGISFQKLLFEWKIRFGLAKWLGTPLVCLALGISVRPEHRDALRPLFS